MEAYEYPPGLTGAWAGVISASSDREQAVHFIDMGGKTGLHATVGSYFVILSDEARPVYYISQFPEEMEYLHTLDVRLEVDSVFWCRYPQDVPQGHQQFLFFFQLGNILAPGWALAGQPPAVTGGYSFDVPQHSVADWAVGAMSMAVGESLLSAI